MIVLVSNSSWRRFIFLALLLVWQLNWAQMPTNVSRDSLMNALKNHSARDSARVLLLNQLAFTGYYADPVGALTYGFEARRIADSIHFTRGEADAFRQIGLAFWAEADIPTAINYFLAGLKIAQANHHLQVEADITGNIGTSYNGLGNPEEALVFLTRAREMQQKLHNPWREASVMNNIGDAYLSLKKFDKAIDAYTIALKSALKIGYKLGITTNLRNLANIFELSGKYDSALVNYFKCISLSSQISDYRGYILANKSIASVFLKKKELTKALQYAHIALDEARKRNLRAFIRDTYEILYKINDAQGNQGKAFENFKLFSAYKDSVQNLKVITEVDGQRLRFETEKKQSEIGLLKKDAELQAERLSKKNSQLYYSILLSLLILLSLGLSLHNFLRVKKNNLLLKEKNDEINLQRAKLAEQNDELIALNEEIRSQQEEVTAQRDMVYEKNQEIEKINLKIIEMNKNLEQLVAQRTSALEKQNKKLSEYAFMNAHKLRAPLARVMGLVNLLLSNSSPEEQPVILLHLKKSSDDLDAEVRKISTTIQEGMDIFPSSEGA